MKLNAKTLSPETLERIDRHHDSAVKRALAGELIGSRLLTSSVRTATAELVSSVASTGATTPDGYRSAAMRAIHVGVRSLHDGASTAALAARGHARELARRQLAEELREGVAAAGATFQVQREFLPEIAVANAIDTADQDAALATLVGMRVSQRWSAVALSGLVTWRRQGGGLEGLIRQLNRTREDTADRVGVEAATTTFDAFNDEHRGAMRASLASAPRAFRQGDDRGRPDLILMRGGLDNDIMEPGLPLGWGEGMMDIWSAVLDRNTCPRCMELDGSMVPIGRHFPGAGRPPIHACCRCTTVSVYVPELVAKRLPGMQLDYAALKGDIKDYMRGSRLSVGPGQRHAPSYVREVLGDRTSPEVLTRRMLERRYFPDMPARRATAPRLAH